MGEDSIVSDYLFVRRVVRSCDDVSHIRCAMRVVDAFGRKHGYDSDFYKMLQI